MGSFKEIEGDMLEMFDNGDFNIIAHGCNCYATFGAGIALTIGNKYPEAKRVDKEQKTKEGLARLGKLTVANILENDGYIYNLYTQQMPGPDFRMQALRKSLRLMKADIIKRVYPDLLPTLKIGFPLIGCGIAGGDWDVVKKEIQREFEDFDVTAVHFNKKVIGVNYWPKRKKQTIKK